VHAFWLGTKVVIGYRALEFGAGPAFLGLLATAFAVPALIASLPVGRLTDRLGGARAARGRCCRQWRRHPRRTAGAPHTGALGMLTAASPVGQAVGPPAVTAVLSPATGALSGTDADGRVVKGSSQRRRGLGALPHDAAAGG
jgi:hypothetical protein